MKEQLQKILASYDKYTDLICGESWYFGLDDSDFEEMGEIENILENLINTIDK